MVLFVERVGVVGAGTMGAQLAEVLALNGKQVVLKDVEERFVKGGMDRIRGSLNQLLEFQQSKADREVEKFEEKTGVRLTPEQRAEARKTLRPNFDEKRRDAVLAKIKPSTRDEDLKDVDLLVEAVVEKLDVKRDLFGKLDAVVNPTAVFATNTSALPVSEIQETLSPRRRQKFLGLHFFNPVQTLPLVEVIAGRETSEESMEDAINFIAQLRNHRYPLVPVRVKETPGFLVNRILGAMLHESFRCFEEKIASARDVDIAMKAGAGFPMGPLELADMVGLDVIYHAMVNTHERTNGLAPKPPRALESLVKAGHLGKKTGKGFFDYT
jgi:3-hydroxybutyryl-CoA dehydrogenase